VKKRAVDGKRSLIECEVCIFLQGRQVVSYTKALDALMVFGGSAVDANWLARSFAARHPVLLLRIRLW
jgi:hypothetical protein